MLHHRLPLPPLLLALLLAVSCHDASSGDDNYDRNLCLWQNSTCGNINITYPFYLHNETAALRGYDNSYCGYPGLRILCEDRKAVLQLDDDNYTVSEINYKNFTISLAVADQEAFDDEGCPRLDYRTTIPPHLWLSYPEATVGYLIFFLCNFTTGNPPITMSPIPCSRYEGLGTSFVLPRDDVPDGDWQKTCQKIKVPVLKYVMSSYQQKHIAWSSAAYGNALRTGFQLVWEQERRETSFCNRCEKSSGRCGYNQMGEFVGCLCSDETVEDQYCSNSSASSTPSPRPSKSLRN
ncbi:hypothetical protein QOZ80_1AG0029210 [Eleusine coracana subsp. coracana]|nr:hypothetical protein QOZ80_1AG0029210 [Eleusine coracana subsp. coracana]